MAEIGLAASIISVIQISQTVIAQAYKYGQTVKNAAKDIQRIDAELNDVGNVLTKLRDLAHKAEKCGLPLDHWPTLVSMKQEDGPLSQCESGLKSLLEELTPVEGWARVRDRALWPHKMKKVEKALGTIKHQKTSFMEALKIEQMGQVLETGQTVTNLYEAQNDESRNIILNWLSHVDPTTNYIAALAKHEPETGDWFVQGERYTQWRVTPNSFLWIHGIPGCGKSVLCSTIIENTSIYCASQPASSIAYFYFSFNETEKQKTYNFLCSVLAQLARPNPRILDSLQSFYNRYRHGRPSMESLKTTIRSALELAGQTFIIADGLDECPTYGEERTQLFAVLKEFSTWALPNLHILVTSRREPDIVEALAPLVTVPPVCIQSKQVDSDIRLYVNSQLANDLKLKKWSPQIKQEIQTVLAEGANGMFRWVVCQLDSLRKCLKPNHIRQVLTSLPKTLSDTYAQILLNIDVQYHQEAVTALKWLAFSERPLRIEELAEAAVINPQADPPFDRAERLRDPYDILLILSSLVTLSIRAGWDTLSGWTEPENVEEVRLAHFSVKEYLTSDQIRLGRTSVFSMTDMSANRAIAECSILYIMSYDQAENKSFSDKDLEEFPLLQYACRLWHAHITANQNATKDEYLNLVLELFVSRSWPSSWLQVNKPDLPQGSPFDNSKYDFASPLYYAAYLGLYYVVEMLTHSGADVNAWGGNYGNVLQAASVHGHNAIVERLLEKGADVNAQGGFYNTALQAASGHGHNHIVERLIEEGADVNMHGGDFGNALLAASTYGHDQIAKLLLKKGADVSARGGRYDTALQAASSGGNEQIVKLLLEKGAIVNAQGGIFSTALHAASARGHDRIVERLLDNGADVNLWVGDIGTALQAASIYGHDRIVERLLQRGADVNAQSGKYGTALQAASVHGHDHIVERLLEKGADINPAGMPYLKLFRAASVGGHLQIDRVIGKEPDERPHPSNEANLTGPPHPWICLDQTGLKIWKTKPLESD